MNTRAVIATRIRQARQMAGLSQSDLAQSLSLTRPSISEIEVGNRKVSAEELVQLSKILDVSIAWLVGEEEERLATESSNLRTVVRELSKLKPVELEKLLKILAALLPD